MSSTVTFVCTILSRVPLRAEPSHKAELISELLFGERAIVLQVNANGWAYIRCTWDKYEGWCKITQLQGIKKNWFEKPIQNVIIQPHAYLNLKDNFIDLPLGSELNALKLLKQELPKLKGKKQNQQNIEPTTDAIIENAYKYLHSPYNWGGRTESGIDCSGLSQMAYKLAGYALPRDASQQAEKGTTVDFLQEAQAGDLAFFNNADGHIIHVGILVNNQTIIHATEFSGKVVVDKIDNEGIINIRLKKRTHQLRVVKRFL